MPPVCSTVFAIVNDALPRYRLCERSEAISWNEERNLLPPVKGIGLVLRWVEIAAACCLAMTVRGEFLFAGMPDDISLYHVDL